MRAVSKVQVKLDRLGYVPPQVRYVRAEDELINGAYRPVCPTTTASTQQDPTPTPPQQPCCPHRLTGPPRPVYPTQLRASSPLPLQWLTPKRKRTKDVKTKTMRASRKTHATKSTLVAEVANVVRLSTTVKSAKLEQRLVKFCSKVKTALRNCWLLCLSLVIGVHEGAVRIRSLEFDVPSPFCWRLTTNLSDVFFSDLCVLYYCGSMKLYVDVSA